MSNLQRNIKYFFIIIIIKNSRNRHTCNTVRKKYLQLMRMKRVFRKHSKQETMIASGDRNIHVISAETFVLFDDHVKSGQHANE